MYISMELRLNSIFTSYFFLEQLKKKCFNTFEKAKHNI